MAIYNAKQYIRSMEWLIKFHETIEELQSGKTDIPETWRNALIESYQSEIVLLDEQMDAYAKECNRRFRDALYPNRD